MQSPDELSIFKKDHKKQLQSMLLRRNAMSLEKFCDSVRQFGKNNEEWQQILNSESEIEPVISIISDGFLNNEYYTCPSTEFIAAYLGTQGAIKFAANGLKNKKSTRMALSNKLYVVADRPDCSNFAKSLLSIITHNYADHQDKKAMFKKNIFASEMLTKAAEGGNDELIPSLLNFVDVNEKNHKGMTAIMAAVIQGKIDTLKLLLTYNPNIDEHDDWGNTALILAASYHIDKNAISLILEKGANINKKNKREKTALSIASDRLGLSHNFLTMKYDNGITAIVDTLKQEGAIQ